MIYYFNTLPKTIINDSVGNQVIATDLLVRSSLIKSTLSNPLLYYTYDIKDTDTPEIIADKYYDNSYRYWIILFVNNFFDAQWEWPLNSSQFNSYVEGKYDDVGAIHHYEKTIEQYEQSSKVTTTETIEITEDEYNDLTEGEQTITIGESTVVITTTGTAVTNFDYEFNLNEAKRNIKLLKADYVFQIEKELKELMGKV